MARFDSEYVWRRSARRTVLNSPSSLGKRAVQKIVFYIILMLAALLLGMYFGWWSLMREEENTVPEGQQAQALLLQKPYLK